jgi:hypothetical protein
MTKEAKRIGRPMKAPARGKRVSLGLKVTAEVKRHIDKEARASGRTQSQEAEALIERALQYDRMLDAMRRTLGEIAQENIEAAFHRQGYTPIRDVRGKKAWAEPGFSVGRSEFIPQEAEDKR